MELISIHALREEGDLLLLRAEPYLMEISIHALREEGDRQAFQVQKYYEISIHALREEGDKNPKITAQKHHIFLSTPSARRATRPQHNRVNYDSDFYPRPPRGGRLRVKPAKDSFQNISIHALREEGDPKQFSILEQSSISIHALREEGDARVYRWMLAHLISIHALREEGD